MIHHLNYMFRSIGFKFILAFIVVGIMPLGIMSYAIFSVLETEIEDYMVTNYQEIMTYLAKNIELKVTEYDVLTQSPYYYQQGEPEALRDILLDKDYANLDLATKQVLTNYSRSLLYAEPNLEGVFLLDPDGEVFNYYTKRIGYFIEDFKIDEYERIEDVLASSREMVIIPTHESEYLQKSEEVITFGRKYLDVILMPGKERTVFILLIDINRSFIDDLLENITIGDEDSIHIIDSGGYPIYSSYGSNNQEDYGVGLKVYEMNKTTIVNQKSGVINKGEQYIFFCHIEDTQWVMIHQVNKTSAMYLVDTMRRMVELLFILSFLGLLILAFFFSRTMSKPIRSIIRQMNNISEGDLDSKLHVKGSYEVNQLVDKFNEMVDKLGSYINQVYGARIKQRDAQLSSIRAQIRPHYLYNTLEIIRMSAMEEGAKDTREMVFALSEQLKYVIGETKDFVFLKDELDMVQNYFNIISFRYEKRIRLEIDVKHNVYGLKIIKLVLQPIVENAVIHGLVNKEGQGKVRISVFKSNDVLIIQIIDDGIGMSESKVQEIRDLLDSDRMGKELDGKWENIGLKNVHDRIKMVYGEDYGIEVTSIEGYGTKMTISVPIQ